MASTPAGRRSICLLPSVVGFFRFDFFDDFVVRSIEGRGLEHVILRTFACGLSQTALPKASTLAERRYRRLIGIDAHRATFHLPSPSVFSVPSVVHLFHFDLFARFVVPLIDGRGLGLVIVRAFACGLSQTALPGTPGSSGGSLASTLAVRRLGIRAASAGRVKESDWPRAPRTIGCGA